MLVGFAVQFLIARAVSHSQTETVTELADSK